MSLEETMTLVDEITEKKMNYDTEHDQFAVARLCELRVSGGCASSSAILMIVWSIGCSSTLVPTPATSPLPSVTLMAAVPQTPSVSPPQPIPAIVPGVVVTGGPATPCDPSIAVISATDVWTLVVTNNPMPMHLTEIVFHSAQHSCASTTENARIDQLAVTGPTNYPQGASGTTTYTYNTAQYGCGREQIDVNNFIGVVVNHGVDCAPPPAPSPTPVPAAPPVPPAPPALTVCGLAIFTIPPAVAVSAGAVSVTFTIKPSLPSYTLYLASYGVLSSDLIPPFRPHEPPGFPQELVAQTMTTVGAGIHTLTLPLASAQLYAGWQGDFGCTPFPATLLSGTYPGVLLAWDAGLLSNQIAGK
jgi:hypothetical protein